MHIILSCEHAGNEIPAACRHLFKGREDILQSHRGWDIGALDLARTLTGKLPSSLHFSTTSRLLVDLNRSPHHPSLFSEFTRVLPEPDKNTLLRTYYFPYRNQVERSIENTIRSEGEVIHLSIHSFTPIFNKEVRNCDVGLLYDPRREAEKAFCHQWKTAIRQLAPHLRVRFNYPYLGRSDGFTTYLRKQFPENYAGIELEVNQGHFKKDLKAPILRVMAASLSAISARG